MGSTRLPGKSLAIVLGRTLLDLMLERVERARTIDAIVVATTTLPCDDQLARIAPRRGLITVRGSEQDVLSRYVAAAEKAAADVVVRLTADCPLLDPDVIDHVVSVHRQLDGRADLVTNAPPSGRTYPDGMDVEVFDAGTLARLRKLATSAADREHVTRRLHSPPFTSKTVELAPPAGDARVTVDDVEDLERVSAIFEQLYPRNPAFGLEDVLRCLAVHQP